MTDLIPYSIIPLKELLKGNEIEKRSVVVVRVSTNAYYGDNYAFFGRKLTLLKRKSQGYNFLWEDMALIGAEEVLPRITNIHDVKDGIYWVSTVNEYRDYETGHIEDYDYKLIPYNK